MELPIEQIADLVATLRMQHDRTERERRHLPRFPVWAPVTVRLEGADGSSKPLDVSVTDLGCGGVGLLSPRPLAVGEQFHVELPATEAPPLKALCAVVHASRGPGEGYAVGAKFIATYSAEGAG